VIHAYLGCKIVATQKQLMGISSVIKEISGRSTYIIYSTHFIIKHSYDQDVMKLTISLKKFLTVLIDKLK
jgi:hypothetical protein